MNPERATHKLDEKENQSFYPDISLGTKQTANQGYHGRTKKEDDDLHISQQKCCTLQQKNEVLP